MAKAIEEILSDHIDFEYVIALKYQELQMLRKMRILPGNHSNPDKDTLNSTLEIK